MQLISAIFIGKLIFFITRHFKLGGGSAAPGLYALKIEPRLVELLMVSIPKNVTITGTNGKTTTARLLAHFAKDSNIKLLRNTTGSNLERGIASTLISEADFLGRIKGVDLGIWELDEAAFNNVALKIQPQIMVFLNAFRDQLDRYGEVDSVVKKWKNTLKKISSKTNLLINGDDNNTSSLTDSFNGQIETFGVQKHKIKGENPNSKNSLKLNYEAKKIEQKSLDGTTFELTVNNSQLAVNLPVPGIYHVYDFLAAFSAGLKLGFDSKKMIDSLEDFSPAFGRFEKIKIGTQDGYVFLIKNPAGATQVFETIAENIKKDDRILLCLNDNFADGTDISWIWDAEFESLVNGKWSIVNGKKEESKSPINHKLLTINYICSGSRAYDLAVRVKYAGVKTTNIQVEENIKKALESSKEGLKGRLFILPTYTALLELQQLFTEGGIKKHYWKEDN